MQHHGVDAVAGGLGPAVRRDHQVEDAAHLALGVFQRRSIADLKTVGTFGAQAALGLAGHGFELGDQRRGTTGLNRHGFDHRNAEFLLQARHVDDQAAFFGDIHHVQRQDGWPLQADHFQHQTQVQAQIGGVDHQHDHVRWRGVGTTAEQHVTGDGLVRRHGVEAVGTRQVNHLIAALTGRDELALLALDGHAGVVGHFLARAGKAIEQRSLAAVGVANQRQAQRGGKSH